MAKLYFKYGAMGSSKSAQALITQFNYEELGMSVWLIKPSIDTRDGADIVQSRIGLKRSAEVITPEQNIIEAYAKAGRHDVIIADEAQFFTPEQIDQLRQLVDDEDLPVLCFGLRTDFLTHFFPGARRLMELADSITEIKTICRCGRKATVNARIGEDGQVVTSGSQVLLGGNDRYEVKSIPPGVEWSSQNMLVLGLVVLAFLVVHMIQFWAKMQLAEILEFEHVHNGVEVPPAAGTLFIQIAFAQIWTPIVYIIGFVALWFHLNHGFWSMMQSVGWNNDIWIKRLKCIGFWWTTIIVGLFIAEAVVFTVRAHRQDFDTQMAEYVEWKSSEYALDTDAESLGEPWSCQAAQGCNAQAAGCATSCTGCTACPGCAEGCDNCPGCADGCANCAKCGECATAAGCADCPNN